MCRSEYFLVEEGIGRPDQGDGLVLARCLWELVSGGFVLSPQKSRGVHLEGRIKGRL